MDKKGTENQVADHLSLLSTDTQNESRTHINESFPDECLFFIDDKKTPWFADLVWSNLICSLSNPTIELSLNILAGSLKKKNSGAAAVTLTAAATH